MNINVTKSVVTQSIYEEISENLARGAGAASLALRRMIPRDHSFVDCGQHIVCIPKCTPLWRLSHGLWQTVRTRLTRTYHRNWCIFTAKIVHAQRAFLFAEQRWTTKQKQNAKNKNTLSAPRFMCDDEHVLLLGDGLDDVGALFLMWRKVGANTDTTGIENQWPSRVPSRVDPFRTLSIQLETRGNVVTRLYRLGPLPRWSIFRFGRRCIPCLDFGVPKNEVVRW